MYEAEWRNTAARFVTFDRPHFPAQDSDMESQSAHVAAATDVQWV